jgi:hypothetical protein
VLKTQFLLVFKHLPHYKLVKTSKNLKTSLTISLMSLGRKSLRTYTFSADVARCGSARYSASGEPDLVAACPSIWVAYLPYSEEWLFDIIGAPTLSGQAVADAARELTA